MRGRNWVACLGAAAMLMGSTACAAPEPAQEGPTSSSVASTESTAATTGTADTASSAATQAHSAAEKTTVVTGTEEQPRLKGLQPVATFSPAFSQGYDAFALRLIQQTQEEGKNGFVSPASVYLALGMVSNGAAGETARQLCEMLGVSDVDALNQGCRDLQSRLNEEQFKLANGIWINDRFASGILPDFSAVNQKWFGARLRIAPFTEGLRREINQWVADNTAGRIDDLLQDPLDADCLMLLVNTLLFEDQWEEPFLGTPEEGTFHGADKDVTLLMMSKNQVEAPYYEDEEVQATQLRFHNADASMLFVLPKQEGAAALDNWLGSLTAEKLRAIASSEATTPRLILTVPKCKLSYDGTLNDALQAMGIQDAFLQGKADFRKMASLDSGLEPYIDEVLHRTELEMDEKGVLAAAATAVALDAGSAKRPDVEPKEMRLDRPFFCAIVDNATGAILFGGAVNQPDTL